MPRSRSRSIESSSWARIDRGSTVWVSSRMRSASVDLPWSMWAMIEKLRMWAWSAIYLIEGRSAEALGATRLLRRGGACAAALVTLDQAADPLGEQAEVVDDV